MPLKIPSELEADATTPQCLDNHYVSDKLFSYLIRNEADYSDPKVRAIRKSEIQTEFIRSLIYSSQVVVNRAYLVNNDYLYANYEPEDRTNFMAFCQLLLDETVVPFLYSESSLTSGMNFDLRKEGDRALKAVVEEVGEVNITCVRLAAEDGENDQKVRIMSSRFAEGLYRLQSVAADELRTNAMAAELFSDKSPLHRDGAWQAFRSALRRLATYAFAKAGELSENDKTLTRTHVYRDHIVVPGSEAEQKLALTLGRFRKPDQNDPFVFEMKKLVDLIYNTNLPDMLDRYTFTPETRSYSLDAAERCAGHLEGYCRGQNSRRLYDPGTGPLCEAPINFRRACRANMCVCGVQAQDGFTFRGEALAIVLGTKQHRLALEHFDGQEQRDRRVYARR